MDTQPDPLVALSNGGIVALAPVSERTRRGWASVGVDVGGKRVTLRTERQGRQYQTRRTWVLEFLAATAAVRAKANRSTSV